MFVVVGVVIVLVVVVVVTPTTGVGAGISVVSVVVACVADDAGVGIGPAALNVVGIVVCRAQPACVAQSCATSRCRNHSASPTSASAGNNIARGTHTIGARNTITNGRRSRRGNESVWMES